MNDSNRTTLAKRSSKSRATGRWVRLWDRAAESVITLGGLVVLAAMLGICVFLVGSALPLFRAGQAEVGERAALGFDDDLGGAALLLPGAGDRLMAIGADGRVLVVSPSSGGIEHTIELGGEGDRAISAIAYEPGSDRVYAGLAGGGVRTGRVVSVDVPVRAESLSERVQSSLRARSVSDGLTQHGTPSSDPKPDAPAHSIQLDPSEIKALSRRVRELRGIKTGVWAEQVGGVLRVRALAVELGDPLDLGDGVVTGISGAGTSDRKQFVAMLAGDGTLWVGQIKQARGLGGGKGKMRLSRRTVEAAFESSPPDRVLIDADGTSVLCVWPDGRCQRYAQAGGKKSPYTLVQSVRLVEDGRTVTSSAMALGSRSLLVGDSGGTLSGWAIVAEPTAKPADGRTLVRTNAEQLAKVAVTSIGNGRRDRTVACGLGDGSCVLVNMTSGKRVARLEASADHPLLGVALSNSLDRVALLDGGGGLQTWQIEPGHSGVSARSLFGRIHFEGYTQPEFVYQSTGSSGAEPKYSLVPLIWGTLKATVVAMLFAVPLGVLAAVYTSEFLTPGLRKIIKPTMELMATLPSVVLGFMAAALLVPIVRDRLMGIMVGLVVVPIAVMVGASLWRLVPMHIARCVRAWQQLGLIAVAVLGGVVVSLAVGPVVERVLFVPSDADRAVAEGSFEPVPAGDWPAWVGRRSGMSPDLERKLRLDGLFFRDGGVVRAIAVDATDSGDGSLPTGFRPWLDGNIGGPWPGWVMACFPLAGLVVWLIAGRLLGRVWNESMEGRPRTTAAVLELGRLVVGVVLAMVLAGLMAWGLTTLGFDPRDSIFGSFTQRNTLVVGLVMGIAVIPIIYTISEDALSSVPAHLRSASLGTGATPWQTAVRVVLPVAMSGIFSAVMIGLGRAVGETMIVLMATGNTPEMDFNLFSGFRTLAANIAVELPEAPRGGTHYRVLFLCGLTLFAMTLVINTVAEFVRQHFRKRSAGL